MPADARQVEVGFVELVGLDEVGKRLLRLLHLIVDLPKRAVQRHPLFRLQALVFERVLEAFEIAFLTARLTRRGKPYYGRNVLRIGGKDAAENFRRFFHPSQIDQHLGERRLDARLPGRNLHRPPERLFRLFAFAKQAIGMAKAHNRLDHARIGGDGFLKVRQRLARLVRGVQAVTEIVPVEDVFRLRLHRFGQAFDGDAGVLRLRGERAEKVERFRMIGIVAQHQLVEILGLLELARLLQGMPALQKLQRLLGALWCEGWPLLGPERQRMRFHLMSPTE